MEAKKSLMPQNFKNDINWIIDAYELAKVTFPVSIPPARSHSVR